VLNPKLLTEFLVKSANNAHGGKRALITGSAGQDGRILGGLLLDEGFEVFGISKGEKAQELWKIGLNQKNQFLSGVDLLDINETNLLLDALQPDEIYHFAGVHAGALTMDAVEKTSFNQMRLVHVNILENFIIWLSHNSQAKLTCALSSQMYSALDNDRMINSYSRPNPSSPYGHSKLEAFNQVIKGQECGLKVFGAILFNHTSKFSKDGFIMQDLAKAIMQANSRNNSQIYVMNRHSKIDLSDATEVCNGIISLTRSMTPSASVIGRGNLISIEKIVMEYFKNYECREIQVVSNSEKITHAVFADSNEMELKLGGWVAKKDVSSILAEVLRDRKAKFCSN
jgi:GDPmannose 4,6-dehydratase